MRDFIGNPFDQENDDVLDDFELTDGDFVFETNENPFIVVPPYEVEGDDEDEDDVILEADDDDLNDPDYDYFQDNNGYNSSAEDLEFSSDEGNEEWQDGNEEWQDEIPRYNIGFSSDEDEDELGYVTFPLSNNDVTQTESKSSTQESSSSTSNPAHGSEYHHEENT